MNPRTGVFDGANNYLDSKPDIPIESQKATSRGRRQRRLLPLPAESGGFYAPNGERILYKRKLILLD